MTTMPRSRSWEEGPAAGAGGPVQKRHGQPSGESGEPGQAWSRWLDAIFRTRCCRYSAHVVSSRRGCVSGPTEQVDCLKILLPFVRRGQHRAPEWLAGRSQFSWSDHNILNVLRVDGTMVWMKFWIERWSSPSISMLQIRVGAKAPTSFIAACQILSPPSPPRPSPPYNYNSDRTEGDSGLASTRRPHAPASSSARKDHTRYNIMLQIWHRQSCNWTPAHRNTYYRQHQGGEPWQNSYWHRAATTRPTYKPGSDHTDLLPCRFARRVNCTLGQSILAPEKKWQHQGQ
jgi:hypothetical protein